MLFHKNDNMSGFVARDIQEKKEYLDKIGLGHLSSLFVSFVKNYASPKTHNHDGTYANASHTHTTAQVTGLDAALAGKAPTSHTHTIGNVSNLQQALDGKVPSTRTVNKKALSADITLSAADVGADASGAATNALNSAKQYTDSVASGKANKSHTHDASNIASGTVAIDRLPVVPATKGGTGQTTANAAANSFINALAIADGVPSDADYIISQYTSGGTTNTSYYRRPISKLWAYVKAKCDSLYQPKGSYASSSHTHDASNIASGTIAQERLPIISPTHGGTGHDNLLNATNEMLDGLSVGGTVPADNDYIIAQTSGSGVAHKKPLSALWTWIKVNGDTVYQPKGSYASSSHNHDSAYSKLNHTHNIIKDSGDGRDLSFNYSADGLNNATWFAAWDGNTLKSIHKDVVKSMVSSKPSLLSAYPVGAVYISWSSTSPASLFGGTWAEIKGVFPYFNAGISQGGSNSHTLSINELARHNHTYNDGTWLSYNGRAGEGNDNTPFSWVAAGKYCMMSGGGHFTPAKLTGITSGNNAAHNNMPKYQTMFAWRRTA